MIDIIKTFTFLSFFRIVIDFDVHRYLKNTFFAIIAITNCTVVFGRVLLYGIVNELLQFIRHQKDN